MQLGYRNAGANTAFLYAGSVVSATASDGSWHSLHAIFANPASNSDMNVDGSSTTGGSGGSGVNPSFNYTLFSAGGGQFMSGKFAEAGVWKSALTSGQASSLSSNQHSYWGF
jgi:hypothetical protein